MDGAAPLEESHLSVSGLQDEEEGLLLVEAEAGTLHQLATVHQQSPSVQLVLLLRRESVPGAVESAAAEQPHPGPAELSPAW